MPDTNPFSGWSPEERTSASDQIVGLLKSGKLTAGQIKNVQRARKLLVESGGEAAQAALPRVQAAQQPSTISRITSTVAGFGREAKETAQSLLQKPALASLTKPSLIGPGTAYTFLIEPVLSKAHSTYIAHKGGDDFEAALGALATLNPLAPDVTRLYGLAKEGKSSEAAGRGLFDALLLRLGGREVTDTPGRAAKLAEKSEILAAKTVGAKDLVSDNGARPGRGVVEANIGPTKMMNLPGVILDKASKQFHKAEAAVLDAKKAGVKVNFESAEKNIFDPHEATLSSGTQVGASLLDEIKRFRQSLRQSAEIDPVTKKPKPIDLTQLDADQALRIKRQVNAVAFGEMRGFSQDLRSLARQLNFQFGQALDAQIPGMPPGGFRLVGDLIEAQQLAADKVAKLKMGKTRMQSIWGSGLTGPVMWATMRELGLPHATAFGATLATVNILDRIAFTAPTRLAASRLFSIAADILDGDVATPTQRKLAAQAPPKGGQGPAGPGPGPRTPGPTPPGAPAPAPPTPPAGPAAGGAGGPVAAPAPVQAAQPSAPAPSVGAATSPGVPPVQPSVQAPTSAPTSAPVPTASVDPSVASRVAIEAWWKAEEEKANRQISTVGSKKKTPTPSAKANIVPEQSQSNPLETALRKAISEAEPGLTRAQVQERIESMASASQRPINEFAATSQPPKAPATQAPTTQAPAEPATASTPKKVEVTKVPEGVSGLPEGIAEEMDRALEAFSNAKTALQRAAAKKTLESLRAQLSPETAPEVQKELAKRTAARKRKAEQRAKETALAPQETGLESASATQASGLSPEEISIKLVDTYKAILQEHWTKEGGAKLIKDLKKSTEGLPPEAELLAAQEALELLRQAKK